MSVDFHMKNLSGTILVADDDGDIREILRDTLNSLGARIVTAVDGQDCLDRIEADAPDVLLLDIEMPLRAASRCCRICASGAVR
jgi:CheY-like chemotaxis protein